MKNILWNLLFALFAICWQGSVSAQEKAALYGLSNYRIPLDSKGDVIGSAVTSFGENPPEMVLLKDTSGIFTVDKKGILRLKKSAKVKATDQVFRYGITLKFGDVPVEFELLKDEFIKNKVVAHRGAWKNHPAHENSLSALKYAIEIGAEASEFDVWMSADNIPVVCHNASVGDKMIEQTTAKDLQKISLGNGDFVPTLRQYLEAIKSQNKTQLVLEIKSSEISQERSLALTDAVVRMVHELKVQAWVDYISFNYGVLARIRELDLVAKTAYLSGDKSCEELAADKVSGIDYPFHSFHNDEGLAGKAHQLGLSVNVWTVDKEDELRYFLNAGADQITTNEPEQLLKILNETSKK